MPPSSDATSLFEPSPQTCVGRFLSADGVMTITVIRGSSAAWGVAEDARMRPTEVKQDVSSLKCRAQPLVVRTVSSDHGGILW